MWYVSSMAYTDNLSALHGRQVTGVAAFRDNPQRLFIRLSGGVEVDIRADEDIEGRLHVGIYEPQVEVFAS